MLLPIILGYVLGVASTALGVYLCAKFNAMEEPREIAEEEPDEKEAKLYAQWENLLNYDGNKKE